ncbi:MAG: hypothetical protein H8E12_18515 [Rhodobacteraceae bacterium]|nr:hypothetical protein [Paracoccaceae bacterium]
MSEKILTKYYLQKILEDSALPELGGSGSLLDNTTILWTNEEELNLNWFDEIEEDAATFLANFKREGVIIELNGLTRISNTVAESLSITTTEDSLSDDECMLSNDGNLHLNGLIVISDESAEFLSNHRGELQLNSLSKISVATAKSFSKHKGYLELQGVHEISAEAAKALSKRDSSLYLGIKDVSEKVASHLVSIDGEDVELTLDLTELKPAIAEIISSRFGPIYLLGVAEISDESAEALTVNNCIGDLHLGIETLSDNAAKSLAKCCANLYLNFLTDLSVRAAENLQYHQGWRIELDGIKELSKGAADAIIQYKGKINDMDPKEWVESLKNNE